jgi:probable rRNA maturation factor
MNGILMNTVEILSEDIEPPLWTEALERFVHRVLSDLKQDAWEVSFLLCSDDRIQELNRTYRGKDEPTDVLSFSSGDDTQFPAFPGHEVYAGDIVICPEAVKRNAQEFGTSWEQEMRRVAIHGILHLMGMDHVGTDPEEPMIVYQEEILSRTAEETLF